MDISWRKDIKYNNEINKKFMTNTTSNKNNNNIFFNPHNNNNNNINMTEISSNNKKEIYLKNNINPFIAPKNNDNYQSYHILYLNNPNTNINNQKSQKILKTKIMHNYYQSNNNKKRKRIKFE